MSARYAEEDAAIVHRRGRILGVAFACLVLLAQCREVPTNGPVALFDGHSLAGWHVSAASPHSRASGYASGGLWMVRDGAIVGGQDLPGNGGLLVSDESFRDVDVVLEVRVDFGMDSGLFLRSSEAGHAYQAMIDYYPGGTIAGIWGERLGGDLDVRSFVFDDAPTRILPFGERPPPVPPEQWRQLWREDGWNELRVRIEGDPPHIATWINGVRVVDFTDDRSRRRDGALALQVHGGLGSADRFARFRDIRVQRLD